LTNIKSLQSEGVTYSNAFTCAPSDSFPGETNYFTGANPGTTGIYYDVSYNRSLYPPGTTNDQITAGTVKPGTVVTYDESIDASWSAGGTLNGGQGIDTSTLPVDSNGNPVYPSQYLQTNTIFDVATAAGLRTAWADKHVGAYTVFAGNQYDPTKFNYATGQVGSITDYGSIELNAPQAIDPTKPGPLPNSLGALVDQSTGTSFSNTNPNITSNFYIDATKGNSTLFKAPPTGFTAQDFSAVSMTANNDDYKVKEILNEIDGLDHTGTNKVGTPAIFGMNFQAVSVGEKETANNFYGGGIDSSGNARPDLITAVNHTDQSIGLILNELQTTGLASSTLVVLTAKHGQNPAQDPTVGLSSSFDSTTGQTGGDGNLTAVGALLVRNGIPLANERGGDTSSLIYLQNQSDLQKALTILNTKDYSFDSAPDLVSDPSGQTTFGSEDAQGTGTILSGQDIINAGLGNPATDTRTPDIVVELNTGYFFGDATKKRAEHGGFTNDDTHVALIMGSAGLPSNLQGTTNTQTVSTTQIAPTTLGALGLDPTQLQGVQIDGTQSLNFGQIINLSDPVSRFYDPSTQAHLYTADSSEVNSLTSNPNSGYTLEGTDFYASLSSQAGLVPVYRFYNPTSQDYFYTASTTEEQSLANNPSSGYNSEGISFYAYAAGSSVESSIYRFFDTKTGQHFYTGNSSEMAGLSPDWTAEGVAFNAVSYNTANLDPIKLI